MEFDLNLMGDQITIPVFFGDIPRLLGAILVQWGAFEQMFDEFP